MAFSQGTLWSVYDLIWRLIERVFVCIIFGRRVYLQVSERSSARPGISVATGRWRVKVVD